MEHPVIVGLTTIPSRLSYLRPTIESILNQTRKPDNIYISIPYKCRKNGEEYDQDKLNEISAMDSSIIILRFDEDLGPVMKLKGMLSLDCHPETSIITVDDDVEYHNKMVENLLNRSKDYPNTVLCYYAINIGTFPFYGSYTSPDTNPIKHFIGLRDGSNVDIVGGVYGVLYKKKYFDHVDDKLEEIWKTNKILQRNDDIYISAWLDSNDIPKKIIYYQDNTSKTLDHSKIEALHKMESNSISGNIQHGYNFLSIVMTLCNNGYFAKRRSVDYTTNVTFWILFIILIALLILAVIFVAWVKPTYFDYLY